MCKADGQVYQVLCLMEVGEVILYTDGEVPCLTKVDEVRL
jgi:hypothetical protein